VRYHGLATNLEVPVDKKQPKKISVELGEAQAEGTYCNLALITHSGSEFILDFAKLLPGLPKAKVCTRMIMTPQNAKALLKTLEVNVQRYEENFGEIKLPGKPPEFGIQTSDTKN